MASLAPIVVPDRPLIAYAFLAQTSYIDGDLMSSLVPIFKPLAKLHEGAPFEPKQFAVTIARVFGIDVQPWAVEDLAPRLERAGLLRRIGTGPTHEYVYAPVDQVFNDVTEVDIRRVVAKFQDFANPILKRHFIPIDNKALEEGFLDQLIKMDFMAIVLKPDRSKEDQKTAHTISLPKPPEKAKWEEDIAAKAKIDVLCASFILNLYREDRPGYELLVRIVSGALLAEVILNIQDPGLDIKLDRLNVILDAPFLMSILDLTAEETHEYARKVLDTLIQHGASISTFRHYAEEIRFNLDAVAQETAAGRGFRATARRLSGVAFQKYAATVARDVPEALAELRIRIIDPPSSKTAYQYLSEEEEDRFFNTLGVYRNQHAQRRDAATIASIVRMRANKRVKMAKLNQADHIFVTDNAGLVKQACIFLRARKLYSDDEAPPAVTDRYLAGLLWVLFGGKAQELSRFRLLANCTAALDTRNDVVSKTYKFLSEVDEQKAQRFRAIITTERGSQHLMQITLGDSLLVTKDNASELLQDIEDALAEKFQKHADERIDQVLRQKSEELQAIEAARRADYEHLKGINETLKHDALNTAAHLIETKEVVKHLEDSVQRLTCQLDNSTADRVAERSRTVLRCVKPAIQAQKYFSLGMAIVFAIATAWITYELTDAENLTVIKKATLAMLIGTLTGVGFWKIPDYLLGSPTGILRDWIFQRYVAQAGAEAYVHEYKVDWQTGTVIHIKPKLAEGQQSKRDQD